MEKYNHEECVEVNDNNVKQFKCITQSKCVLPLTLSLLINLCLIIAILVVSALWAYNREHNDMHMIPSPNKNRSISVPTEAPGEKPKNLLPEEYISSQIEKRIRKSHMTYMADKLNYANVVCRKHSPSVYLFKALTNNISTAGSTAENLKWELQKSEINIPKKSIKYNSLSGLIEIIKEGPFFLYSQITETAEKDFRNDTVFHIYLISKGKTEKILESVSGVCDMMSKKSKRSHYVGSSFELMAGDRLFSKHSHPKRILKMDSFLGIRELT